MFEEANFKMKILIILVITNLLSIGYNIYQYNQKPIIPHTKTVEKGPTYYYVHIKGEVNSPGYYKIMPETRLFDLIELAGGVTAEADLESINLAQVLQDQQQIVIRKQSLVVGENGEVIEVTDPSNQLVNINTANLEDLKTLTGIGDVKAKAIIDYRNRVGYFNSIEEVMNVKGIGESTFNGIKDFICV
jgi:competence protein ComEA